MKTHPIIFLTALVTLAALSGQTATAQTDAPQTSAQTYYTNPIIHADYSDPDVCRVGKDFYMTSSSFNCIPGLQILHSTDLVHWEIIGAALEDYPVEGWTDKVQHGNGIWAPAIRHHNGEFYIYCGDPDRGIFMVKTSDPRGHWDAPVWVVKAKGYIDPCPLWDDDGNAYLSHGCAGSRAGIKSVLFVAPMSPDGTELLSSSRIVYDGHKTQPTIEGTKFYKRNGWYYIFAPAGGVSTGWQTVLRSRSPYGPYEEKVVMAQGNSSVNGPHQGAWIDTPAGEDWFLHFQDKGPYGRITHLQPMTWVEDWPVIGIDEDGDGVGEPVMKYRMPTISKTAAPDFADQDDSARNSSGQDEKTYHYTDKTKIHPADSDEFNDFRDGKLGLQWQWQGTPSPYWWYTDANEGVLRLYSVQQRLDYHNLSDAPNLLLQKFPAENFTVTAKLSFHPNPLLEERGEACGLVVFGNNYSALRLEDTSNGIILSKVVCNNAMENTEASIPYGSADIYMRVEVHSAPQEGNPHAAICTFSYSTDGKRFRPLGEPFTAVEGAWIGAKVGLFCIRAAEKNDSGWVDIDYFKFDY